jgi:Tfp pilus assembly protein PilV
MDPYAAAEERERGESLLELLIAVVIVGITVIAVIGGLATSIAMSDIHRKQSTAGAYVRSYAEAIQNAVAVPGTYSASCTTPTYASGFSVGDSRYGAPRITKVSFWNGSSFPTTACDAATDVGVQQLTLEVASLDGRASEQLVIVVRKPCFSLAEGCT